MGCLRTAMQTVCPPQKNTVPVKTQHRKHQYIVMYAWKLGWNNCMLSPGEFGMP
jgi:hypothetical protein